MLTSCARVVGVERVVASTHKGSYTNGGVGQLSGQWTPSPTKIEVRTQQARTVFLLSKLEQQPHSKAAVEM